MRFAARFAELDFPALFNRPQIRIRAGLTAFIMVIAMVAGAMAQAQELPVQKGEAFLTRFSGAKDVKASDNTLKSAIDLDGVVGSLLNLRNLAGPGRGQKLDQIAQRLKITARQVGQIFGIAFDNASPPNIYLSATAAFGLHRTSDNSDWMAGMWGPQGGPGSIWKLNASNGYTPELFASVALAGRQNSGAGLGNIAFDPWNKQLYVSDLETGMIHRFAVSSGSELGHHDHGIARSNYVDAQTGTPGQLPGIGFMPESSARIDDCPAATFAREPKCWNLADFRRRVWGLAVRRDDATGAVRLFYASWSGQGFGLPDFQNATPAEKENAVWSVAISNDGSFDGGDVRREFTLPAFFVRQDDIARAGKSHPVSDIAFGNANNQKIMLLAERGGLMNGGLSAQSAFASLHQSRVLRYVLNDNGVWSPAGRYDVGFYDRKKHGPPYLRAGNTGGVSFGFGYGADGTLDETLVDDFVWMSGAVLCGPFGPCYDPLTGKFDSIAEVSGVQGTPAQGIEALSPIDLLAPYPGAGPAYPATGMSLSYLLDPASAGASINASGYGDIEIFAPIAVTGADPQDVAQASVPPGWPPYPDTAPAPGPMPAPGGMFPPGGALGPGGMPPPGGAPPPGATPPPGAGEVIPPAPLPIDIIDLKIEKEHVGGPCKPGAECRFKITVTNVGQQDYKGTISFTDTLPAGWTLVTHHGGLSVWICEPKGSNKFTCKHTPGVSVNPNIDRFGPGAKVSVTISAKVPANAVGPTAENCAEIIDNPKIPQDLNAKSNDRACAKATLPAPQKTGSDLEIKKDIVGMIMACKPDSVCKFEITITNKGPDPYHQPIVFEDAMPVGWKFVKQTGGGWQQCTATGRIIRCETIPVLLINPPIVTLKPNQSIKLGLELKTPPAKADSKKVWNCAKVFPHSSGGDNTSDNDKSCILLDVPGMPPELRVIKKGPAKCFPGKPCDYVVSVYNSGKLTYEGEVFIFEKVNNVAGVNASDYAPKNIWKCTNAYGGILCAHKKIALPPNKFLSPLMIKIDVPANLPAQIKSLENCAEVQSKYGKHKHCISTPVERPSSNVKGHTDWALALKELAQPWCWFGFCTTYEFQISNKGPDTYAEPMELRVKMPKGARFKSMVGTRSANSCSAANWSCSVAGSEVICRPRACRLDANEAVGLKFDLKLLPKQPANIPPKGMIKTVCGELTWVAPRRDSIEQSGNRRIERVCGSTEVRVPRKPTRTAPPVVMPRPPVRTSPAPKAKRPRCFGGQVARGNRCVCPRRRPVWNGQRCITPRPKCFGGQVARGARCVCPRSRPVWTGQKCVQQRPRCFGGQVARGNRCVCPRSRPVWTGQRCVQQRPRCFGGQVARGNRCVCPSRAPVWNGRNCAPRVKVLQPPRIPAAPKFKMIPGRIICPQGSVWSTRYKRCINTVQ